MKHLPALALLTLGLAHFSCRPPDLNPRRGDEGEGEPLNVEGEPSEVEGEGEEGEGEAGEGEAGEGEEGEGEEGEGEEGEGEGESGRVFNCGSQAECRQDTNCEPRVRDGVGYLFCEDDMSWHSAAARCRSLAGALVGIEDAGENSFLAGWTQSDAWIGLNDVRKEGDWRWEGGEPDGYASWDRDEPNNNGADDNEDCVHLLEGGDWNDGDCDDRLPFVCQAGFDGAEGEEREEGESCDNPIDLGNGGRFHGDLRWATSDEEPECSGHGGAEHVAEFEVPLSAEESEVTFAFGNNHPDLEFIVRDEDCRSGDVVQCMDVGVGGPSHLALPPGTYFLHVRAPHWLGDEPIDYEISVGVRSRNGSCRQPDDDDDGFTICDGDCDDGDPDRHPGRDEACDGSDNDCSGRADDVWGECDTGERGQCSIGRRQCGRNGEECAQMFGAEEEICHDDIDNDCDGDPDENECVVLPAGETCGLAIDVGQGGVFEGSFDGAQVNGPPGCGLRDGVADHMYRFEVGGDGMFAHILTSGGGGDGVEWVLRKDDCRLGEERACFGPDAWFEDWLDPGDWWLIGVRRDHQASMDYRISIGLGERDDCKVDDGDGDGFTICQGDCDDRTSDISPTAEEVCDGVDNDCQLGVDRLGGRCTVQGEVGACMQGRPECDGMEEVCQSLLHQRDEACGDTVDNDCDGDVDEEEECADDRPGESCANPQVLEFDDNGSVEILGNLNAAFPDVIPKCDWFAAEGGSPDLVYRFDVPDREVFVHIQTEVFEGDVAFELRGGGEPPLAGCVEGDVRDCWPGGHDWGDELAVGTWHLIVRKLNPVGLSAYGFWIEIDP